MPRCVRNFWLDARIDGRTNPLSSGPKGRDGGFQLAILSRDRGEVFGTAVQVIGRCCGSKLVVTVLDGNREVLRKETAR